MEKTIFEKIGGVLNKRAITFSPALHYHPKKNSRLAYLGGSI